MEVISFAVFSSLLLALALQVTLSRSPLRAALALIVAQLGLAGLYVLLSAPFVAAMQALLYAGAVMVLFVFVIMLLNMNIPHSARWANVNPTNFIGVAAMAALGVRTVRLAMASPLPMGHVDGSVHSVGALLTGPFAFFFEVTSLVLLTSVVGAVTLSLKKL